MTCTELTALGVNLYWSGASNPVPNLVSLYARHVPEATYMK
jgi:hypothetical protein